MGLIELGMISARTEGDSCPGQQNKHIGSWSNSGRMAWSDVLTTTGHSSSNCISSMAAITICTPSARSVASERNSGAAMIRSGTIFAPGQRTKSTGWIARPVSTACRLVRYAVRSCKGRPRPVFRSFDVFVAATPISGGALTSGIDFAWVAAARMIRSLSRDDSDGKGERDRPGRSVRRLAEQLVRQIPLTVWCARTSAAGSSAGRRRERSRRPRSPCSTATFRLNRNDSVGNGRTAN